MLRNNFFLFFACSIPALIVCMIYSYFFSIPDISYDRNYLYAAENILERGYYTGYNALPLYPYFLAILFKVFGTNYFVPIFFQAFFHGLTAYLLAKIAKFYNSRWFYPTLIISSLWPHLLWRTTYIFPETLFVLFTVLSLYFILLFLKKKKLPHFLLSSFFLGLSLLTKSSNILVLYILPFLYFFLLYKKENYSFLSSLRLIIIYFVLFSSILSFQFFRIYKETGYFGYNYQSGTILLGYTYPCLAQKFGCGSKNMDAMHRGVKLFDEKIENSSEKDAQNFYYRNLVRKDIAFDLIKDLEFKDTIISATGGYLKLFFHNFTYDFFERLKLKSIHLSEFPGSFFSKMNQMLKEIFSEINHMFLWFVAQFFLFFSRFIQLIGFYSFFIFKNKKKNLSIPFLSIFFFLPTIIPVIGLGTIRYRAPLEPLLIILTISGLFFIYKFIKKLNK